MSKSRVEVHRQKRRKNKFLNEGLLFLGITIFILLLTFTYLNRQSILIGKENDKPAEEKMEKLKDVLAEAETQAAMYHYDEANRILDDFTKQFGEVEEIQAAKTKYEEALKKLDPLGAYESIDEISHVFFHSLIADTAKAFDGDYDSTGYNYYMTTVSEFKKMMQEMYEAGYVLVSIHDVVKKETLADGSTQLVPGDIMLPPDKKPFVLSQDDINYYEYMEGDGFASRVVINSDGKLSTEMKQDDGTVITGDFDVVPVLESFIAEHPDFSYKGARGILAITGYEGAFGYRTNDPSSPTYEKDKESVRKVAALLKKKGWELASHSYGHRDMNKYNYPFLVQDTDRWLEEVGSLIGPTDIYIFPFGADIEDAHGYDSNKYLYLKKSGFDYYCGVYKAPWMQLGKDYLRMTRRPLDGQAMLEYPERLKDLFNVDKVVDEHRPRL